MAQESEHRKLNIPEFKEGEATWWVQGRDTKSTSARHRAAKRHFYWVVFASVMITVFGGLVLAAIIYAICYSLGPKETDLFTPEAKIWKTFEPGHQAAIQDMIYSPDGLFLITASEDSTAVLMDAETGEVLRRLEGHQQGITAVAAVSLLQGEPESKEMALAALRILTGSKDIRAILWNPELNPPLQQRLGDDESSLGEPDVNIFEIPPGHTKAITSVALSFDGRYALTGGLDNQFLLWDTVNRSLVKTATEETDQDINSFGGDLILPHNGPVMALAFNPDGRNYASGSEDCLVKLWDSNNDKLMQTFNGHNSAVTVLQFGASGKTLLSAGRDQRILIWDLITGARKQILESENEVKDASLSANERFVTSTMFEKTAVLWDAKSGEKLAQFIAPSRIVSLAVSPRTTEDGIPLYVATATVDNQVIVFTTANVLDKIRQGSSQGGK